MTQNFLNAILFVYFGALFFSVTIGASAQSEIPKSRNYKRWLEGPDDEVLDRNYEKGTILPKPQYEKRSDTIKYTIDPTTFKFNFRPTKQYPKKSEILTDAFIRYKKLTFPGVSEISETSDIFPDSSDIFPDTLDLDRSNTIISSLEIKINSGYQPLSMESNESYTLHIKAPTTLLEAESIWGALRGLETFSQAVYKSRSSYSVYENMIEDYPRFKYRGFLIDTARHYLPKATIFQFLDAMSFSKFNVLHWHIVDDQSFPYVSKTFPQLHMKGAFNMDHVYTPDDVSDIIKYAEFRGIRVIPEFDTPGHTHSWKGVANLLTDCPSSSGVLNPILPSTYTFLERFFEEVAGVFPDKYIHLGGDEIKLACWLNDNEIQYDLERKGASIDEYGGTTLYTQYMERLVGIMGKLSKSYIVWQDVFDDGVVLDGNAVVNVWKDWGEDIRPKVTAAGYQTIYSSCWYLDHKEYGSDWIKRYECDPHDFYGTDAQKKLVIGGSAAVWGEYIDATNLIQSSFGRGFAVAERLWSDERVRDVDDAKPRIHEHRCRYINRGIPAEPVLKAAYCRNEWNQ